MLIYFGQGHRDYVKKPAMVHRRRGWEFQAVVNGSISLLLPEGPGLLKSNTLWLFPPNHGHGWTSEKEGSAEVVVFHFLFVPELIENLVRSEGYFEMTINDAHIKRLLGLAEQTARYWQHMRPGMMMCYEHVLLDLSMILWEGCMTTGFRLMEHSSREKVNQAMEWFATRMADNPDQNAVAKAVGTSPSHLRRLFHEILQSSPKHIFDQMRFQRAMQLMADPAVKLSFVSETCGFGGASSFSRAFKSKFGCSPDQWRS